MKFPKADAQQDGGLFFKLKDGESKTGILRGEVYEFGVIWADKRSKVVPRGTEGSRARYKINVVVFEDNKFQAKIWEFSQTVCNQLADLATEYDLSKTKIKVSRSGSELDTEYSIIPTKEQPGPGHMKAIEQVSLNILDNAKESAPQAKPKNFAPGANDFGDEPNWDSNDMPF